MTIFEKIFNTLEPLNIPVVRSFYKGTAKSYIIVSVYNDSEGFVTDDDSEGEIYHFKMTYWREGNEIDLTRQIKKLMKEAQFRRMYVMDTFYDDTFGTIFDYQGVLWNHELEEEEIEEDV